MLDSLHMKQSFEQPPKPEGEMNFMERHTGFNKEQQVKLESMGFGFVSMIGIEKLGSMFVPDWQHFATSQGAMTGAGMATMLFSAGLYFVLSPTIRKREQLRREARVGEITADVQALIRKEEFRKKNEE